MFTLLLSSLPSLRFYFFLLAYLFTPFVVYFLTYLLLPEQDCSVSRQEVVRGDQTWLCLFFGSFYVVAYFVMNACLLLLCLF